MPPEGLLSSEIVPYEEHLALFKLFTLVRHRYCGDIITTYRIINSVDNIEPEYRFEPRPPKTV